MAESSGPATFFIGDLVVYAAPTEEEGAELAGTRQAAGRCRLPTRRRPLQEEKLKEKIIGYPSLSPAEADRAGGGGEGVRRASRTDADAACGEHGIARTEGGKVGQDHGAEHGSETVDPLHGGDPSRGGADHCASAHEEQCSDCHPRWADLSSDSEQYVPSDGGSALDAAAGEQTLVTESGTVYNDTAADAEPVEDLTGKMERMQSDLHVPSIEDQSEVPCADVEEQEQAEQGFEPVLSLRLRGRNQSRAGCQLQERRSWNAREYEYAQHAREARRSLHRSSGRSVPTSSRARRPWTLPSTRSTGA